MDDNLVEILAEGAHRSWARVKLAHGFADHVFEPVDSAEKHRRCRVKLDPIGAPCWVSPEKHHPDMLPYAELSEPIKDYDRAMVRGVLEGITEAGYQIVPITANEETPSRG